MSTKKVELTVTGVGSTICKHQSFVKEWAPGNACIYGIPTGNYLCAQCGLPLSVIQRGARR